MIAIGAAALLALQAGPVSETCGPEVIAALTSTQDAAPLHLTCHARLPPGTAVLRPIVIEGAEGSGVGLDCQGGSLGRPGVPSTTQMPTVSIRSRFDGDGWSRPVGVRLSRCTIYGNVRVWGMGAQGRIEELRTSSRAPGHLERAQAAAPTDIRIEDSTFVAAGSIPLYVGPGVTGLSVTGGRFLGRSVSTAIYLDAESARAEVEGVTFDIRTDREQIAVDGSAGNRISGNRFRRASRGGVFLYRNCGEDGVVRHQSPTDNRIENNAFEGTAWIWSRAVVVGSREGRRRYCGDDAGWPFGSSIDDRDGAERNVVRGNRVRPLGSLWWFQAGRG
jgi:hypothetical protein